MTLKKGQIIKDATGNERKVLAVSDDLVTLSYSHDYEVACSQLTEKGLRDNGYTWSEPEWEPEIGEDVWYISAQGQVEKTTWTYGKIDRNLRDFLGVYPTEEAAIKRRDEIKRKIAN